VPEYLVDAAGDLGDDPGESIERAMLLRAWIVLFEGSWSADTGDEGADGAADVRRPRGAAVPQADSGRGA